MTDLTVDVLVVGGGPSGLSAALALGRAHKSVLLCDIGKRRNAAADHMHGFVTRDGVPPSEFRRIAREQLRPYAVTLKDASVERVERTASGFDVTLGDGSLARCRRILLAMGVVDQLPSIPGLDELWGHSVFSCPYCHGWEVRDRRWGILATDETLLEYAIFLTGWTRDVVAFTQGADIPEPLRIKLEQAGVVLEPRRVARFVTASDRALASVETEDGASVPRDAMIVRPPQKQVSLIEALALELDPQGFVRVDGNGETSTPGIYAAGDLTTHMQAAMFAAAAGTRAAYLLNYAMNMERAAATEVRRTNSA